MTSKENSLYSVKLKIGCVDPDILRVFEKEIRRLLDDKVSYTFLNLPGRRRLKTVLRSPHVNKKSREHFSLESYSGVFTIREPSKSLVKVLMTRLKSWSGGEFSLKFCERYGKVS